MKAPPTGPYQDYLIKNNKSANTIRVYTFAIRQFYERYEVLTEHNLQLYKLFLLEHYKPRTVNLRIRAINSYLEFSNSDYPKMIMIKMQQQNFLENVISQADYEYLKNCLKRDGEAMCYFVVRFMAATGARVSEVTQFTAEDVGRGHKDLYSKDNKIRRLYIPKALKDDAGRWLKREGRTSGPIFLNRYGNVITSCGIRSRLKHFSALYGLDASVMHPHAFRHRFAKNFIEQCGDIALLSDLLGHENIETTRVYLRRTSTEQQKIINAVVDW